jgi:hypothetical protein
MGDDDFNRWPARLARGIIERASELGRDLWPRCECYTRCSFGRLWKQWGLPHQPGVSGGPPRMRFHGNAKTNVYQRRLLIRRVRHQGWTHRRAAGALGVSVRTVAKWLAREKTRGSCFRRRRRRRSSPSLTGDEMGNTRPVSVLDRVGLRRITPPVRSTSSHVKYRISLRRQPE